MRVGRVWGHFLALRVWLSVLPCASLNLALVSSYTNRAGGSGPVGPALAGPILAGSVHNMWATE